MRLIDADLLKRIICEDQCGLQDGCGGSCEMTDYVEDAPTIDVELVRHGHWILPDVCYEDIECSVCHAYMPLPIRFDYRPTYKYCPMCGAKMDEVIT